MVDATAAAPSRFPLTGRVRASCWFLCNGMTWGRGLLDTGFAIFAASVWSLSPGFAIDGKLPRVGLAVMDEEWELHATATI